MKKVIFFFLLPVLIIIGGIAYFESQKDPKDKEVFISFVHIGDIHGHLLPRENLRFGEDKFTQGGLARLFTIVNHLRERDEDMILINTGDTIQGSAEALFTRGEALVEVLNTFGIDYYAPGNWDWLYGKARFEELFVGEKALAPWNPLMANLYDTATDKLFVAPYKIQIVKGVKIGFIGFTSEYGPALVGDSVVDGLKFSNGDVEFKRYVTELRPQVDVLVVLSELGLAKNIQLAKETPGVNFLFSSGMHEETSKPVVLENGTVLMEEGQDGTRLGELNILLKNNKLLGYKFKMHIVDEKIPENTEIAALVEKVRAPFVDAKQSKEFVNPFSKRHLKGPIDEVIGETQVDLHRSTFSAFEMPAVVEGSSHDFITDAFRVQSGADIGLIRGFRYGTHVKKGDIRREDLYHFIPMGPFVAKGEMRGKQIKDIIEHNAEGSLAGSASDRKGGWLFGWSGLHYDLNPNEQKGKRSSHITVLDKKTRTYLPLEMDKVYTVASYNYDEEPEYINEIKAEKLTRVLNAKNEALDATEVAEAYLKNHKAKPELNRIRLLKPLRAPTYTNKEIQPLP